MAAVKKKKIRRNVTVAIAHVRATFNDTTVTITDTKGDTLCWASAGTCGFKGSRKSTPFAGQCAGQQAAEKASKYGVKELEVRVKGILIATRTETMGELERWVAGRVNWSTALDAGTWSNGLLGPFPTIYLLCF